MGRVNDQRISLFRVSGLKCRLTSPYSVAIALLKTRDR